LFHRKANMSEPVDVAHIIENQRPSRFLFGLVVLSWLITFLDGLDTNLISFAAPYLAADYGLDRVQTGNIFSIHQLGALVGGFVFAYWGDIIGRRPAVIVATAAFGCLTMGFYFADGYGSLLLLRFLDGIPLGGMLPLAWALNIEYAPKMYRATIVTVIMAGYSLGTALGGPVANAFIPRFGWRAVFLLGGAAALGSALILLWKLPESIRFLVSKNADPKRVGLALQRMGSAVLLPAGTTFFLGDEASVVGRFEPSLLFKGNLAVVTPLIWLAYVASSFAVFFVVNWTPIILEGLGYSRQQSASAAALNSIVGIAGGLLLMRLTDRYGASAISVMPAACAFVLVLAGSVAMGADTFLMLIATIGFFLIGGHFGMHSICGLFYPSAYRGNGAGWAASVAKVGSIAGPLVGGWALSASPPTRRLYTVLAVCPLVFAVCIFVAGRMRVRST
jgi:MFS transporter, AAHS family, 4-hydroxybenzoate transporter